MPTPDAAARKTRYRCNQKLCVRYEVNGQKMLVSGRCTAVNKRGIGATVAGELAIGQQVWLEISLNNLPAPRRLRAEVKNRKGTTYGFEFKEADERTSAFLSALFMPDAEIKPKATIARTA
jgi:hypothetical protein